MVTRRGHRSQRAEAAIAAVGLVLAVRGCGRQTVREIAADGRAHRAAARRVRPGDDEAVISVTYLERDTGFEPATFSLGS